MKNYIIYHLLFILILLGCSSVQKIDKDQLTIAFGSCDNQRLNNPLWEKIDENKVDVWIWGGDNVYCDTNDMLVLKDCYEAKKKDVRYQAFTKNKIITGTWDDHDYARNDGGEEFEHKKESQQLFLDFMDVGKNSPRRKQEGIYSAITLKNKNGKTVKIINLDTRYFRSSLTKSKNPKKRFDPNADGQGTMLGDAQWDWLYKELLSSSADFTIIVSSIQFLSNQHGFEMWANMPHEVQKLENTIKNSEVKNLIILSGDRHISEFSKKEITGLNYPLIDFTSSGLTHVYEAFKSEENAYRIGNVVNKKNFGLLKINFEKKEVLMEIRGENNEVLGSLTQKYPR